MVNGRFAVRDGTQTRNRPGRVLKKGAGVK
jgi:hypothetical protein